MAKVLLFTLALAAPCLALETLTLTNGLDAGTWGPAEFCPHDNSFAAALEVKYHGGSRRDLMGVTGLRLYCQSTAGGLDHYVSSSEAQHGQWLGMAQCPTPQFLDGVVAQVLPAQGSLWDDQGVTNVQMTCNDGTLLDGRHPVVRTNVTTPSAPRSPRRPVEAWGAWQHCSPGHLVCGIQTRVDQDSSLGDDAGVTDFIMYCCPL